MVKKKIPANFSIYLNPIVLAYWIMCDGSKQNLGLHLNTYGFTLEENNILILALNNYFDINCSIHKHPSGCRIYINKKDLNKIKPLLIPYILPSKLYKLSL